MSQVETHHRTCILCEAMCGIEIKAENQKIISIQGDNLDPFSKGHICPKAIALKDLHEDPDRLKYPIKKTDHGWIQISWDEAFDFVANQLKSVQQKYGKNAVGIYLGNPNTHHHGITLTIISFLKALRTKNKFSATSNDQLPSMLANLEMFGHQHMFPIPDIDHTDLFICLGGNPLASNGSLMSAPDFKKRLKNIQNRDGKVIVIDPRKTETAKIADQHIFIRPATDSFFLLSILNVLVSEDLIQLDSIEWIDQKTGLEEICEGYTPETVEKTTGISAKIIYSLARDFANTPKAVIYGRLGISTQEFGGLNAWLINLLNIVTGKLDQEGGILFTKPAIDMVELGAISGQKGNFNRHQSRVRGLPSFSGELPASTMAEEILTEGEGKIHAMVTCAGNPILSSPNGKLLDQAFESLDFMVSIDFYLNETTRHADIILPPTSSLEHSHYDVVFNLFSVRNRAKYSPALFPIEKDKRHDWQILSELTRRLNSKNWKSQIQAELSFRSLQHFGVDGLLDILLRMGPYGSQLPIANGLSKKLIQQVEKLLVGNHPIKKLITMSAYGKNNQSTQKGLSLKYLKNFPHGIDLGALQPSLPDRLYRKDKKVQLFPQIFTNDLKRLKANFEDKKTNSEFLLIGRRHVRSNNSWLHNSQRLVKGKNRCTVMIHSDDAKKLNISNNSIVEVASRIGKIQVPVEITDDIMQSVVSIPHGWGHNRKGTQLSIATTVSGVSLNDITDEQFVDQLSGTTALNGVPVSIQLVK